MKNYIFFLICLLFLNNCGFTPIYSNKNSSFKIIDIEKNINNSLTNYVENNVLNFSSNEAPKSFKMLINLEENITVILKDKKGDPSKNDIEVLVELTLIEDDENVKRSQTFRENFIYNVSDNKFELKEYEKNIKQNLIEEITSQILIYLTAS